MLRACTVRVVRVSGAYLGQCRPMSWTACLPHHRRLLRVHVVDQLLMPHASVDVGVRAIWWCCSAALLLSAISRCFLFLVPSYCFIFGHWEKIKIRSETMHSSGAHVGKNSARSSRSKGECSARMVPHWITGWKPHARTPASQPRALSHPSALACTACILRPPPYIASTS